LGVALKDADLWIETNRKGVGNWVFGPSAKPVSKTEDEQPTDAKDPLGDVPPLWVRNVVVHYFDGETGSLTELKLTELNAEPRGGRIDLSLVGELNSEAVNFSALIGQEGHAFDAQHLKFSYQGLDITGDVQGRNSMPGQRPRLTGTLDIATLDMNSFSTETSSAPEAASAKQKGGLFSSEPLPFNLLDVADADLTLNIGKLVYQNFELSSLAVPVSLSKGRLEVPLTAAYEGKDLKLVFSARGGKNAGVGVKFDAPEFDLGRFLKEAEVTDLIEGRASVAVDLKGKGQSLSEIVGSLNGSTNVVGGRGTIGTKVIELIATDLVWALVPKGGKDDGKAQMTCSLTAMEFKQGVGRFTALALVTDRMRTSGEGDLNFKDETIDMSLYPSPNDPSLLSLSTTIRVKGAMSDPSIYPDTGALLVDIATAVGAGVFTGGIGAILPMISLDSFDAESASACAQVVAKSGHGSGGVTGVVKDVTGGVGDVVGGAVEGVGAIIASPF
ncbi:MAG: AsmA family protein, partial [Parvibaculaceae bacterium]|nr:AsmA family protein [Parvibaculaceae bacterium]